LKTEYLIRPRPITERSVVAVGSFDGLHLGHRAIFDRLIERAKKLGVPSVVLSFDPHPKQVVGSGDLKLLTPGDEKPPAIAALGVDLLVIVKFDERLAALSSEEFVEEYLTGALGVKEMVLGTDHGFGKNRSGSAESLENVSRSHGFEIVVIEPVLWMNEPIKSNRIRKSVAEGDMRRVAHMLGRPYPIGGEIVKGRGRGQKLGFPTANIRTPNEKLLPPPGVYAASDESGQPGLVYIGSCPTFADGEFTVEFHRIEPAKYKVGERINISLFERFRGEITFPDSGELVKQIEQDRIRLVDWVENTSGIRK